MIKGQVSGTPLVVWWLRLQAPKAGARVRSLVRELEPTYPNYKILSAVT